MALSKILTANGSKGHHKFILTVNEDSTSGNSSFLSFTFQLGLITPGSGWNWYGFGSDVSYTVTIGSNTYSGTIPSYDATGTVTLKSADNVEIQHDSDGTKTINVGFNVTDVSGSQYTSGTASASDTMILTPLHKAPELSITNLEELQTGFGINNTLFVRYVSIKKFTVSYSFYDSATPSALKIYTKNGVQITHIVNTSLSSSTATLQMQSFNIDPNDVTNGKTFFILELTDSKGGITRITTPDYNVTLYDYPNIITTSSFVKRAGQTTGEATLTLVGTFYNGTVGTTQNSIEIKFAYWKVGDTQPDYTNYITIPSNDITISDNNITISDWKLKNGNTVINTLNKDYSYYIGVTMTDHKTGLLLDKKFVLSRGVWIMAKYKDHIDFLDITRQGIYIYPNVYSSNETIVGIDGNKTRYRKVIDFGTLTTANTTKSVAHGINNLDMIKKIEVMGYDSANSRWFPIPFAPVSQMYSSSSCSVRVDSTNINISSSTDWSSYTAEVTLEYTKTTD